jgi:sigma-B regulation protein RsbU (phosphoserine phosphatase)
MKTAPISLLIVDDDPVFARFLQQLIHSLGADLPCVVEWSDTAGKAFVEMEKNSYELVLLDYNLPDGDGLEVLARIRSFASTKQPAVVMLTASGSEKIAVEAMKRGAKDYLTKANLDAPQLTRALQTALAQKRLADQVASYNKQMESELKMARNLQLSLLPDRYPVFPRSAEPGKSALKFYHRFYPAADLAGDFFSVLALSDIEAGVFICDVMGHGMRSALVTAMLRALVDDLAPTTEDPAQFLSEINHRLAALFKPTDGVLFATAFYLLADFEAGKIRYANAGHPVPLHLRRHAQIVAPLPLPAHAGPALGLFAGAKYISGECAVAPDDMLLLFTDGLFEVMDAEGKTDFGEKRLLDAASHRIHLPSAQLLDELVGEVRSFSGGTEFGDDVCLLGMEVAA